jgi:hypothetical protein
MPLKGDAVKVHASMVETYGKEKGERVFYATANSQKRKPETWKKKSAAEKLAAILDDLDDGVPGGLAAGKSDQEFPQDQLHEGKEVEAEEHGGTPAIAKDIAKDHLTEDPKYYTHLEKMEELGGKIMKAAVLMPQKQPSVAPGIEGPTKLIDAKTGAVPQLATQGGGAPQGKPTTPPPKMTPSNVQTPPTSPGTPTASTVASTPTNMPGGGMMVTAAVPRAKTASHAGLLKAQFQALRLSGILNEV